MSRWESNKDTPFFVCNSGAIFLSIYDSELFDLNKCTQVECSYEGEKWAINGVFRAIRCRSLIDFGGLV